MIIFYGDGDDEDGGGDGGIGSVYVLNGGTK